MKRFLFPILAAVSLLSAQILRAEDPDETYLDVYTLVQQADTLNKDGKVPEALAKYRQAQIALRNFQRAHPDWKPKTVEYRANYLAQKVEQLSVTNSAAQSNAPAKSNAAAALPSGSSVKLLTPGAEPRSALRLHPKEGDKQTTAMTMKTAMEMKMGETANPEMKLPAIVVTTEATIKSVSPEGDINYEAVTKDVEVNDEPGTLPQLSQAIKASIGSVKGMAASGTRNSRGIKKHSDLKVPPGLAPQTRQLVDQMNETFARVLVPLPEEPIGIGAKWEVKMPVKEGGISMEQTLTYELASLDGDKAVIRTSYAQTAGSQKVENPSMPGVKLDLTRMTGSGTGETIVDLNKIIPVQTTMDGQSEAIMAMGSGAQKQDITVKTTINVAADAK